MKFPHWLSTIVLIHNSFLASCWCVDYFYLILHLFIFCLLLFWSLFEFVVSLLKVFRPNLKADFSVFTFSYHPFLVVSLFLLPYDLQLIELSPHMPDPSYEFPRFLNLRHPTPIVYHTSCVDQCANILWWERCKITFRISIWGMQHEQIS